MKPNIENFKNKNNDKENSPEQFSKFLQEIKNNFNHLFLTSSDYGKVFKEKISSSKNDPKLLESFARTCLKTSKLGSFMFRTLVPFIAAHALYDLHTETEGAFLEKDRARTQLSNDGITSERKTIYKPYNDIVRRLISPDPSSYSIESRIEELPQRLFFFEDEKNKRKASEDAWALYLGMPQENNTFTISENKPNDSKFKDRYYFELNNFKEGLIYSIVNNKSNFDTCTAFTISQCDELIEEYVSQTGEDKELILDYAKNQLSNEEYTVFENFVINGRQCAVDAIMLNFIEKLKQKKDMKSTINGLYIPDAPANGDTTYSDSNSVYENADNLMATSTICLGMDEKGYFIQQYDLWDLASPTEVTGHGFGKPFWLYNKIYYDPKTGRILESVK